jgi:hypothetical protein
MHDINWPVCILALCNSIQIFISLCQKSKNKINVIYIDLHSRIQQNAGNLINSLAHTKEVFSTFLKQLLCFDEMSFMNCIQHRDPGTLPIESPAHDSRRTMVCAEHFYQARPSNSIS